MNWNRINIMLIEINITMQMLKNNKRLRNLYLTISPRTKIKNMKMKHQKIKSQFQNKKKKKQNLELSQH